MGVFVTASEANRQRVFTLLRVESEQVFAQLNALDKGILGVKRDKPPMSEVRQRWVFGPCDRIRSNATCPRSDEFPQAHEARTVVFNLPQAR